MRPFFDPDSAARLDVVLEPEEEGDRDGDTEPFTLLPCPICTAVTAVPLSVLPWLQCEICKAPYGASAPLSPDPARQDAPSPDATTPNEILRDFTWATNKERSR